jgi:hypothetical protein
MSITLHECGLIAMVTEARQSGPHVLLSLGPVRRVVSFGAFLTFCLDAVAVCRPSLPAGTGLLTEPQKTIARAVDNSQSRVHRAAHRSLLFARK